jgi:hypothetical protein
VLVGATLAHEQQRRQLPASVGGPYIGCMLVYSIGTAESFTEQHDWCQIFSFLNSRFGVFESGLLPLSASEVDPGLTELLNAGKIYPPALSLTQEELYDASFTTPGEVAEAVTERLQFHLHRQGKDVYRQALALRDDGPYRSAGKLYWVVGRHGAWTLDGTEVPVYWVSPDYYLYQGESGDFALSTEQLSQLPCFWPSVKRLRT